MNVLRRYLGVAFVAVLLVGVMVAPGIAVANEGECPAGYEKDGFSGSLSWIADGDYVSVILVGGPPDSTGTNEDPDGRNKVFSNVSEGDEIARVAHDISHICLLEGDPEPEQVWVCRDGQVVGPMAKGSANTGETEYDSAAGAAADSGCTSGPQTMEVCVLATGTVATINVGDFDATLHGAVGAAACQGTPPPPPPPADDPDPVIVTFDATSFCIDESQFIDYLAGGQEWSEGTLTFEYGDTIKTLSLAPGNFSMMDWPMDGDAPATTVTVTFVVEIEGEDDFVSTQTFTLDEDCITEVLSEVEETEVLDEAEELPETGASALLLGLVGLLSLLSGGALLRRRPSLEG